MTSRIRLLSLALAATAIPATAVAQEAGDEATPSMRGRNIEIAPYIEAAQVLSAELEPGDEVVTYTQVAAGVDLSVSGRYSAASASIRYERRFGYGDEVSDGDTVSGLARASVALGTPNITLEAGALASRDARFDELHAALWSAVVDKLEVSNPGYSAGRP